MLPLIDMCKILVHGHSGKLHKKLVHNHMKPRTIRALLMKHSRRLGRTSKIDFRNVGVAKAPVHSILKKRKTIAVSTKRKAAENIICSDPADICCKPFKHSSFTHEDIIVHDQSCLPLQPPPHLKPLCKIVSDVLVASTDVGNLNENPSLIGETKLNDKSVQLNLSDSGFVKNNSDIGETSSEKQLNGSYGHDTSTSLSLLELKTSAEMDLNHSSRDFIDLNCSSLDASTSTPCSMYSVSQKAVSPKNEGDFGSFIGTHHVISSCNSSGQSVLVSDNQHAMSCFDKEETDLSERQIHLNEPMTDICDYFPIMHCIPESMVIGTCSSIGSKDIVEPSPNRKPIWRGICPEQGFIGLPLNSQGELIQFHHGNMHGLSESGKMTNSALNPVHSITSLCHSQAQSKRARRTRKFQSSSISHEDDQHWFSKHYYPPGAMLVSFDSVKFQGLEKLRYHSHANEAQVCSCHSRQIEMCCGCKDFLVAEDYQDRMNSYAERDLELGLPANQSTMRLMGKNITVGSCSKEHHDRKIWTNKEMLRMSCRTSRVYNRSISKGWRNTECIMHAESEKSRELPAKSLEASSLYCCTSADKFSSNQMHPGYESNMFKDGYSTGRSYNFHVDCSASPIPYQSVSNKTCCSAVHYMPKAKSMNEEQRRTIMASDSENFYQHVLPNSTYCRHCQNLSYTIQSTLHPHYINQVPIQTSRCLSSKKEPNHLQNEVCQAPPLIPYHPVLVRQSCSVAEDNRFASALPHTRSVFSYPSGNCSVSPAYGACTPMSAVYSSPAASGTRDNLISLPSTYGYNFKARDEMEFNFSHVKVLDRSKRSVKRPTIRDDKCMEITKKPNPKFQEDSNAHASVRREQLHTDKKDNMRASEINACVSSVDAIDVSLTVANGQKDVVVIAGESFAPKSSQIRSGPVKLRAGAKHILKPNGSLDQENYCPIYISVPFSQVNIAGKGSVSQDKASEPCKC